ncbi:MAG TPA: ProQ/FinO family protein [Azospira sp.]|nr:ProQ/FinO family protein [Azospira sp.]
MTQMTSPAFSSPREFLAELSEKFQVFRDNLPLAIGINQQLASLYPEVDPKLLKVTLFRHTNSVRYLKTMEKGTQRHDLQGNPTGEVAEEHRLHAAEVLKERFKKQAEQRKAEAAAKKAEEEAKQAEAQRAAKLEQLTQKFGRK